jgi:hypothetical protein
MLGQIMTIGISRARGREACGIAYRRHRSGRDRSNLARDFWSIGFGFPRSVI